MNFTTRLFSFCPFTCRALSALLGTSQRYVSIINCQLLYKIPSSHGREYVLTDDFVFIITSMNACNTKFLHILNVQVYNAVIYAITAIQPGLYGLPVLDD